MRKRTILVLALACLGMLGGLGVLSFWFIEQNFDAKLPFLTPIGQKVVEIARPLDKYSYENLRKREAVPSDIVIDEKLSEGEGFSTWRFFFETEGKRVSGALNLPDVLEQLGESEKLEKLENQKIILLIRGYQEREKFHTGAGTERVAGMLAQNGYVTLAPDFLGYGKSASPSAEPFEERFQTYTTAMDLIASIEKITNSSPRLGIWGHSNGGQIALTVLELSGKPFPTVLWNPVSKYFPYSILFFTDTDDDRGKSLRRALAKFEESYDTEKYALDNFLDWIKAPILLQQGSVDVSVPRVWSDELYKKLKNIEITPSASSRQDPSTSLRVSYEVYDRADHNMLPLWNQAVVDLLEFYGREL